MTDLDTMSLENATKLALLLGCSHVLHSSVTTRSDAQGYIGGETILLASHFGAFTIEGFFKESLMLGILFPDKSERRLHRFESGRLWHPDILRAIGTPEAI